MTIEGRFRLEYPGFTLDAQLSAPERGVTALFGPSGCGKTTLLRCIAGLEHSPNGFMQVGESVWQDASRGYFLPVHRRPLGYVFQEAALFPHRTVRGNLEYAKKRAPKDGPGVALAEAAELLGLAKLLERRPARLSGGERQRVAVARALLTGPQLLLMDEPLAALDQASKAEILPFLERLHEELAIPVLYVSHSTDEVARLADTMAVLEGGTVQATGRTRELLTRLDLPLARSDEAEAVLEAVVAGHDDRYHLSHLDFRAGRIMVPRRELPVGRRVRVRIHARDVSLTRERQEGTSILNIFPARVEEVGDLDAARLLVRLDAGGEPLLAAITRKSAEVLEVAAGRELYAQVKSVALLE